MTPFLQRSITNDELLALDGAYEGRVVRVEPQQVFNRFRYTKNEIVPQIGFADGYQWIPNVGARRKLTAALGADTDAWIGRRLRIYLKSVARTEQNSGRTRDQMEKQVEVIDEDENL